MAVSFGPLNRPLRLADQVVEAIRAKIEDGRLPPGTRLPSETVLAGTLGVSRPVLREGLARLRADGFLSGAKGNGVMVAAHPGGTTFRLPADAGAGRRGTLQDLFELRRIVEVSAAELAAARRNAADLAALDAALARVQSALDDGVDGADADHAFHVAIARASGNQQLARFVMFLGNAFSATRVPSWTPEGRAAGKAAAAQAEHVAILAAIRAADPAAAGLAARLHLERSAARTGLPDPSPDQRIDSHESE